MNKKFLYLVKFVIGLAFLSVLRPQLWVKSQHLGLWEESHSPLDRGPPEKEINLTLPTVR